MLRDKGGSARRCKNNDCVDIRIEPVFEEGGTVFVVGTVEFPEPPSRPKLRGLDLQKLPLGAGRKMSISPPEMGFVAEIVRVQGEEIVGVTDLAGHIV